MRIPIDKLDEGAELARRNAWQFLEDAEHLLRQKSYGHAAALAMYAFEEYAKMAIFRAMKRDPTLRDKSSEDMANRQHVTKFKVAMTGLLAVRGVKLTDELQKRIEDRSNNLQSFKERGLYVEYSNKWLTPQSDDMRNAAQNRISETRKLMEELEKVGYNGRKRERRPNFDFPKIRRLMT
jgi:AbiV family abortive infection protein